MGLDNLDGKTLQAITPDPITLQRLYDVSSRSLQDADIAGLSAETRFDLAYKAIMQLANLALQANGYRTLNSKPGHHQTMIQTLTQTIGLDTASMIILDGLRKQRNVIDYSGDVVSDSMATDAVAHARKLRIDVEIDLQEKRGITLLKENDQQ